MKATVRVLALIALLLSIGVSGAAAQFSQSGFFRFVHAIPGVSAVDVYTDGQLTVSNLGFGEATGYIQVPAGSNALTVTPRGVTTALWQQTVDVAAGEPKTLVASSIDPLQFDIYVDDFTPIAVGTTRLRLVHAIAGAGAVDVLSGGDAVTSGLGYRDSVGTFDIPADVYNLTVVAGETEVLPTAPFGLNTNTTYMVLIYGTPATPVAMALAAPTASSDDSAFLRVAHTVAGAPAVDVFANGTKIFPALGFGQTTLHVPIPAGAYTVGLSTTADGVALLETTLDVPPGTAVTITAQGTPEDVTVGLFNDDIGGVTPDLAGVTVVNTILDSTVSVSLLDGTALADGVGFGESSDVSLVAPSDQPVVFDVSIDGQTASLEVMQQLYGGVYYNAIALPGDMFNAPTLVFVPTSLVQGVASAPGSGAPLVVAAAPTEPPSAPTEEPVAPTEAPPVVTEAPPPTVAPTLPPVITTIEPENPTARIILNPGANLQLRQYPRSDALSLGLAPSGTVLEVNAREGGPIDLVTGEEIPIETREDGVEVFWVDPASLLDPEDDRADLDPESTWINVTYRTPDGGEIVAWVNSLYVDLRAPDGDRLRLVELATLPGNVPGEAIATELTPPAPPENRITARVINIDPGANLNMRRTPEVTGEILARLPAGTILEFGGLILNGDDWAYVEFSPSQGGFISGWVSTQYLDYQLNTEPTSMEFLLERDFVFPVSPDVVGTISSDAPSVSEPTQNPTRDAFVGEVLLDAGANLNLRLQPDEQAQVLFRLPSGTQVIVDGRTSDSVWLRTSFEGQQGWIAGQYVVLTYNGNFVDITDVPIVLEVATEEDAG